MNAIIQYFKRFDWLLLASVVMLACFGLVILYSTSLGIGENADGDFFSGGMANFWKQAVFVCVGIAVIAVIPLFNYRILHGTSRSLYIISVILLIAVLLFGKTVRGTTGWFRFAGFSIQPVEIVKVFLLVHLARFFSEYAHDPIGIRRIVRSGSAVGVLFMLVLMQPDFGSASLLIAVWGLLLLVSGMKKSHIAFIAVSVAIIGVVGWMFVLKPYQKERISVFMDPERAPLEQGYNVTQSIIAIGSGGIFGKGLGFGSQSQLRFLPERQTDFIFAALAEELGLVGVIAITVLFGVVFYRLFRIAAEARDDFTLFLMLGIMISIAIEMFVNIGGNLRLLPVTGVTLPFLSYGGSSFLAKCVMIGIAQSVMVRK